AEQLARELIALQAQHDVLLAQHSGIKHEAEQRQNKLAEIGRSLADAIQRQKDAEDQHTQLALQHRQAEHDLTAREEQTRVARQEAEALRQQHDAANAEMETLRAKAHEWEREREALRDQWYRDRSEEHTSE